MQERPRRRRFRTRRPKPEPRPTSSPPPARGPDRRIEPRSDRRVPARAGQPRGDRARRPQRPRDEIRPGTPCVILLDSREGEPDRTGAAAVFEGFLDFDTVDPRRRGTVITRYPGRDARPWVTAGGA